MNTEKPVTLGVLYQSEAGFPIMRSFNDAADFYQHIEFFQRWHKGSTAAYKSGLSWSAFKVKPLPKSMMWGE